LSKIQLAKTERAKLLDKFVRILLKASNSWEKLFVTVG
jgi:hypothetical protein